jgi:outer membrane protein
MQKILMTALAATALTSTAANAQSMPAPVIAIVDLDKVTSECTACKTASASLRSQAQAVQAREKALGTQLETEGKSIQAEIDALKGAEPSAALQTKVRNFQTKQQSAVDEIQKGQANVQRNTAYVQQQVGQKLGPIYQQVLQRRGANIMLEVGSTLASASALDVSADVLAALNTAMPTLSTQAPAQAQQTPQGR